MKPVTTIQNLLFTIFILSVGNFLYITLFTVAPDYSTAIERSCFQALALTAAYFYWGYDL